MDEKHLPNTEGPRRPTSKPRSFWKYFTAGALFWFAVWKLTSHVSWRSHLCHHDGLVRYSGESISWKACGDLNGRELECSELEVPMDQFNPENSGNKTFTLPLIRLRGKDATQNILLNPGGPGGSGIEFLFRRGESLNAIVGEGFHLLSFDPRGVNGSKPLASCYPDKEAKRDLSAVRSDKVIEDSAEAFAWSQNYVKACQETMGEHGKYINTPQTAADMNSILDAVGQQDMIYWGFSYGTILGQTYASLFPERSERVIIDGVANNFDWFENNFDLEALADTENVLLGFFDECIKAGKNCTLSSLAKSKESLRDKVLSSVDKLSEPVSVYVNNTVYGLLNREKVLFNGIFPALYKPTLWYELADRLEKLINGNATEAFLSYAQGPAWGQLGDALMFITMNDGTAGPEHWPKDRETMLDNLVPYMNQSMFSPSMNGEYYIKQHWSIPKTHTFVQKMGVKTAHPLLILSTTYDPVCPLLSARSANAAFEGSQIIEVRGYGHCSISVPSACLAKHVREFLYNGTVPANYTQCDADGPYFIKPEEDGKISAMMHFDDPEEQRIHRAQLEIAQDPTWPLW
ncbi:uncharacterized protein JN550_000840 [Neoarthrinium moseri]|uniref:uncharacterized protein n=1 Tax=Neoarthrinium moseri TaxID=1658444 RepID=UPI001FDCA2FD|nr:uncharacterized protein JN550_000840 [Neoarthrinium moseri]KAI1876768.1 hypothetical protein JN550_000840 [Neoarthrinium moseri]